MNKLIIATKSRWSTRPFVAPRDIHWVKVDRISGKRVFTGAPTSDAKASVIWETFKAESEARAGLGLGTEQIEAQRTALINAIKRGESNRGKTRGADTAPGVTAAPDPAPTIATDGDVTVQ